MGIRKKHHYVPRFYLRRFSINSEGKQIALYNDRNKVFVSSAPIKHQACQEYLYGKDDEVEAYLSELENIISKMFYHWTEEKILIPPPANTNAYALLKRFILFQIYRTIKDGEKTSEMIDQAFKAFIQVYHPDKMAELDGHKLSIKDTVLVGLLYSTDYEYLLDFLDCRFLVNLSELSFITSDSPVVRYNQLMEEIGIYNGATALPVKGLQIFYPIHPRLMICFYDPQIYRCGIDSKHCVATESEEDVHQLNVLQYLNCHSQLFFNELISEEYVLSIARQYESQKQKIGPVSNLTKTQRKSYVYFSSYEDARINLDLTFFSIIANAKDFKHEIAPLRHPSLARKTDKL